MRRLDLREDKNLRKMVRSCIIPRCSEYAYMKSKSPKPFQPRMVIFQGQWREDCGGMDWATQYDHAKRYEMSR
jgi:hypothetical protein